MKQLAEQISDWFIRQGLPEEQRDVYSYGLESLINELLADILLFLSALLLHKIPEMFIWCLAFTILRVNLGGLHASSHYRCIFYSTVIGILSVEIAPFFTDSLPIILISSIFACLLTLFIAPVIHANHPVSEERKRYARNLSILTSLLETGLIFLLFFISPNMASCIFLGLLSATLLGLFGYLKNK